MSAVIVELNWAKGEVGAEVVIDSTAQSPGCAGITGATVGAEMSKTNQPVDEKVKLVIPGL